jgi:hypothetical protein
MRFGEVLSESAIHKLARKLPSLEKHDYTTLDRLLKTVAKQHNLTGKALSDLFVKKFHITPNDWIKHKLNENDVDSDLQHEVDKFCEWACQQLHIKNKPHIELSTDTEEAQNNHHTGGHIMGDDNIWVYVNNRNLVDILRTVFHELVHVRQDELNMIAPGDSYPGSPIEAMADMLAGKYIKIYGEKNHKIFQ